MRAAPLRIATALSAAVLLAAAPRASAQCDATAACGTTVPAGAIFGQTWTAAGSPYCITGDVQVFDLTIQAGVCVLADPGVEIEILSQVDVLGTSLEPVVFTERVAGGGWSGFKAVDATAVTFEYATIERANQGAFRIVDSDVDLADCRINDCSSAGNGGGVNAVIGAGSLVSLVNTVVARNKSNPTNAVGSFAGGGVYAVGNVVLSGCTIRDNECLARCNTASCTTTSRGGGLFASGNVVVENCRIVANLAKARAAGPNPLNGTASALGAGIHAASGSVSIVNTAVTCNLDDALCQGSGCGVGGGGQTNAGSGIYVAGGNVLVENCALSRNNDHGLRLAAGTATVRNSIVYWNDDLGGGSYGPQLLGAPAVSYSNVQGGWTGTGNAATNPIFAGTGCESCDVTILPGSPGVDAGDPSAAYDDACSPPSLGAARNDMGIHGGPKACGWKLGSDPTIYCTAKVNSLGCTPSISFTGAPDASATSGFVVTASNVRNQKNGLLFYKVCGARAAVPFQGGTMCLGPSGIKRAPVQNSGGSALPNHDCSGTYSIDLNAFAQGLWAPMGSPDYFLAMPGAIVHCQWWGRDPGFVAPNNSTLTDALEYYVK